MAITIGWFVLGIIGVHLADSVDWRNGKEISPGAAWFVLLGPIALVVGIFYSIIIACEERKELK